MQVGEVLLSIDTGGGAEVMDSAGLEGSSQAAPSSSAIYVAGASAEGTSVSKRAGGPIPMTFVQHVVSVAGAFT